MKMYSQSLQDFAERIARPQVAWLAAFAVLYMVVHVVIAEIFGRSLVGVLLLAGFGVSAAFLDQRLFELVPTYFSTKDEKDFANAILVAEGGILGFLGLMSGVTGWMGFVLIVLIKVAVPILFGLIAFREFRDNVYPILVRHHNDQEACDLEIAKHVEQIAEERQRSAARRQAVTQARDQVFTFYAQNETKLKAHISATQLYSEIRAHIPDDAGDQQAFAGAAAILSRLDQHVKATQDQGRKKQQRLDEIQTQMKAAQDEIDRLLRSKSIDPDVQSAELSGRTEQLRRLQKQHDQLRMQS